MRTAEIQRRVPEASVLPLVGPKFTPTVTVQYTAYGKLYARNVSKDALHTWCHPDTLDHRLDMLERVRRARLGKQRNREV